MVLQVVLTAYMSPDLLGDTSQCTVKLPGMPFPAISCSASAVQCKSASFHADIVHGSASFQVPAHSRLALTLCSNCKRCGMRRGIMRSQKLALAC